MSKAWISRLSASVLAICATFLFRGGASIALPEGKWNTFDISVCFAGSSQAGYSRMKEEAETYPSRPKITNFTAREKAWIQEIIEQEFTPARTALTFTGWKDCDPRNPARVWIYIGKGGPHGASLTGQDMVTDGYRRVPGKPDEYTTVKHRGKDLKPSYVFLKRLDPRSENYVVNYETHLKLTALHEFGHVAGLAHEHERVEANYDGNCMLAQEPHPPITQGQVKYMSAYDPGSVMNYCYVHALERESGLRYAVALAGRDPRALPAKGTRILAWPGVNLIHDDRVIRHESGADRIEMELRMGLSPGDRHALLCLYTPEKFRVDECDERAPL